MHKFENAAMKYLKPYPVLYKLVGDLYRLQKKISLLNRLKF